MLTEVVYQFLHSVLVLPLNKVLEGKRLPTMGTFTQWIKLWQSTPRNFNLIINIHIFVSWGKIDTVLLK